MIEHKQNYLVINGIQNIKLEKGSISFKNYSIQLPVPFKIYPDFACILRRTLPKGVKAVIKMMPHKLKNIKITFLAVLLIKLFVLIINSVKMLFFIEEKMLLTNLLKQFLKSINTAEK